MRRRSARASGPLKAACASWLSNRKLPRVGWYRPTSRRATVLLPQPDSPTRASVWPFSIVKSTPSTACSSARGLRSSTRLSQGADTSKVMARACACTRAGLAGPARWAGAAGRGGGVGVGVLGGGALHGVGGGGGVGAARGDGVQAGHGAIDLVQPL